MKNNFTTPEQSKRLLEIGAPADSADCYLTRFGMDEDWEKKVLNNVKYSEIAISNQKYCLPCWSVGRLMEIYLTCALDYHPYDDFYTETPSLHFMAFDKDMLIEEVIEIMSEDKMDFSKLEE